MIARLFIVVAVAGCHRPQPPPAPVAVAPPRVVKVVSLSGRVERRSGPKSAPLRAGDILSTDDVVVSAEGASAELELAGEADVKLGGGTEVGVAELTATVARMRLKDGRISAVAHGRRLQVEVPGASAVASATSGEFSMLSSGSTVAVAARSGDVTLSARGSSVRIGAGQLSVVERDHAPALAAAVPPSLYLKLAAAHPVTQRLKQTTLRGSTVPGAVISVGGVRVTAGQDGEFTAQVTLREGVNRLVVEGEDVLGRKQRAAVPRITVDSRAPDAHSRVVW